jgi:hypothetical protein
MQQHGTSMLVQVRTCLRAPGLDDGHRTAELFAGAAIQELSAKATEYSGVPMC